MEFRMAFNQHQSTFSDSLFSTYQHQASANASDGIKGSMASPFVTIPSVTVPEQDTASHMTWPHNAHDDPYELISCAQSSFKNRNVTGSTECDGELDLNRLVSNIVDKGESQDSYSSEGYLPSCNPVWSPRIPREDFMNYFQSEAKTNHISSFLSDSDRFNKAQVQSEDKTVEESSQQFSGLTSAQQWLFNLSNEDHNGCTPCPRKLPPGLPVSNTGRTSPSQLQQSKYTYISIKDRGNSQPLNKFPDLSDVFRPQSEMNSLQFDPYYEDQASRLTVEMQHKNRMVAQCNDSNPAVPAQTMPVAHLQKELLGEFGMVHKERTEGKRKQTLNCDGSQDQPGFSLQNTEHFQQPMPVSPSFSRPYQYHNKMTMHKGDASLPMTLDMNQSSQHHILQGQMNDTVRSEIPKEQNRMLGPGFLGEHLFTGPLNHNQMREMNQALSHNSRWNTQRFVGENRVTSAGNVQQFIPFMYPVNDPRKQSLLPIATSNFSSRATLLNGSGIPGMDLGDVVPINASAAFYSYLSDIMSRRGENPYHGVASAMKSPVVMNQGGPAVLLYFYLDECYEQWRALEKERKATEAILNRAFPERQLATANSIYLPKSPLNATRIDNLIASQMREQARVASLLDNMECLHIIPLPSNIHTALSSHHMSLCVTQARCKEQQLVNVSVQQRQSGSHVTAYRDTQMLALALKELSAATRDLRTALWCALQVTVPKPARRPDQHVTQETACMGTHLSPFDGYSFTL
ncbi:uncharacterized protein moto [Thalassophryne amazonica]|uniref:uncharacterized protein moto n=1 Tax=Thalassophryne amazonica TaxID=390379 RepID=UPI001471E286|nr:uncharacterized protein moto [Thalassophryne amazonica]